MVYSGLGKGSGTAYAILGAMISKEYAAEVPRALLRTVPASFRESDRVS
jgi:hypothetical protein